MKRTATCLFAIVMLCLAACAQSPADRWFQERANLSAAQDLTVEANQNGWINDDDFVHIVAPAAHTARGYLDDAFKLLPDGGEAFDHLMLLLDNAIAELQRQAAAHRP